MGVDFSAAKPPMLTPWVAAPPLAAGKDAPLPWQPSRVGGKKKKKDREVGKGGVWREEGDEENGGSYT